MEYKKLKTMKDFVINITTEDSKNSPHLQLFKDWMDEKAKYQNTFFSFDTIFYGLENGKCRSWHICDTKPITLNRWYYNYYLPSTPEKKPSNEKEIDIVLDVLYALREQDEFYFKSYGKVFIESLLKNN